MALKPFGNESRVHGTATKRVDPLIKQKGATSAEAILGLADLSRKLWTTEHKRSRLGPQAEATREPTHYVFFLDKEKVQAVPGGADQVFPEFTLGAYKELGINVGSGRADYIFDWIRDHKDISLIRVVPEKLGQELAGAYGGVLPLTNYLTVRRNPDDRPLYNLEEMERERVRSLRSEALREAGRIRRLTPVEVDPDRVRTVYEGLYSIPSTAQRVRTPDGSVFEMTKFGTSINQWEIFSEYHKGGK